MNETAHTLDHSFYMKGKSRHLFWPMLAYLVITVILQYGVAVFLPRLFLAGSAHNNSGVGIAFAAVYAVLLQGGWAALLAVYGAKVAVKTYKIALIILACSQLFGMVSLFISTFNTISIYQGSLRASTLTRILAVVNTIVGAIQSISWAACLLVIAFSGKTRPFLCVSAILAALYRLGVLLYTFVSSILFNSMVQSGMAIKEINIVNIVISIVITAVFVATSVMFFAALSFGRQKATKERLVLNQ